MQTTRTIPLLATYEEGPLAGKTQLVMRRPLARDRIKVARMEKNPDQRTVLLVAILCDLTPEAVGELDLADFLAAEEAIGWFAEGNHLPARTSPT